MKLLHTADWHLGKRLENFSRLEEQREVLEEICQITEKENVDAVLIAGDLFDTFNPPAEAVDLFYKTLKRLANDGKRAVIAIAGNHDSPDRIEAPDPLARECGIIFCGYPNSKLPEFKLSTGLEVIKSGEGFLELKLPRCKYPLRLLMTPYANEFRLRSFLGVDEPEEELRNILQRSWEEKASAFCDDKGVNILLTHLFFMKRGAEKPAEPESEKPILHIGGAREIYSDLIPDQIQYTALGHLHRAHIVDDSKGAVVYSGSPLSYSFSEAEQEKKVTLVEVRPGEKASLTHIPLTKGKPLKRKRFTAVPEAIEWMVSDPDCLVELTMATETYLTAEERRLLYRNHQGIVTLIPEVKINGDDPTNNTHLDITKPIVELFQDYFRTRNGQAPGDDLMDLFKEVLGEK